MTHPSIRLPGDYQVEHQVAELGDAAVFLGRSLEDDKPVAIRAFFSANIMEQREDGSFAALPDCEVQYKAFCSDFSELQEYLLELPPDAAAVRPFAVFPFGGTVYTIEQIGKTETLAELLAREGRNWSWFRLKKALMPLTRLLSKLHNDGIYHRGISPETLRVTEQKGLLLTDFCLPAARTAESELAAKLYFGYSAPEQYAPDQWQGSWTDVYSLAAVCYRVLTGAMPIEWRQRRETDNLPSPASLNHEIPAHVSAAIARALSIRPQERFRSIEEFWCALLSPEGGGTMTYGLPLVTRSDPPSVGRNIRSLWIAMAFLLAIIVFAVGFAFRLVNLYFPATPEPVPSVAESIEPQAESIVIPDLYERNIEKVLFDPLYRSLFRLKIERVFSEQFPEGTIISQDPAAGTERGEDNVIRVLVSKGSGRIVMLDVVGKALEEAKEMLDYEEIGYMVTYTATGEHPAGTVLESDIPAGRILYRNMEIVTLTVETPRTAEE